MKFYFTLFITIPLMMHFSLDINGQERNDLYLKDKIGITVSSFLNNYQAVQFNFAKGIKEGADLNLELGYIYHAEKRDNCNGFRIRIQPRFSISNDPDISKFYISPLLQYRYTKSSVENIFSRFDGAYYQQMTHSEVNKMIGIGAMIGKFFTLSDHMYINVGFGLGMNFSKISFPDVPSDAKWQAEFKDIFFYHQMLMISKMKATIVSH